MNMGYHSRQQAPYGLANQSLDWLKAEVQHRGIAVDPETTDRGVLVDLIVKHDKAIK